MRTQAFAASALLAAAVGRVAAQEETGEGVTGELGDAQVVEGNPPGLVYEAVLPEEPFSEISVEGNVKGSIVAMSAPDGVGVEYKVRFSNLPQDGGRFSYHIHVAPVPEDGNCTQTQAHLDPYIRGQAIPCDPNAPETCEVGDLSGKFGFIEPTEEYETTYIDPYSSLIEGEGAFFGNRSFVLHFDNEALTRITCANFELKAEGSPEYPGGDKEDCTSAVPGPSISSQVPGAPAPTGVYPEPSASESLEPVPTAGAAVGAVSFSLLGAALVAGIFGM